MIHNLINHPYLIEIYLGHGGGPDVPGGGQGQPGADGEASKSRHSEIGG